mmetsp:Transcript_5087/g.8879  ORF Transcript_5087/g.8879 Transcript_5087/m.8879 type:complete len:246 (-) Transcript_5087:1311-2048(-)
MYKLEEIHVLYLCRSQLKICVIMAAFNFGLPLSISKNCIITTLQHRRRSSSSPCSLSLSLSRNNNNSTRRSLLKSTLSFLILSLPLTSESALAARPEGVNRPDLLPPGDTKLVLDLENFLTSGQESFLIRDITNIEKKKGIKIRILTQRYPQTPGLAIRDYWNVDDKTVVLVADFFGGTGNLLKFNVGEQVYDVLPPRFWSLLASQYGNQFFVKKNGEDQAIIQAVSKIYNCLLQNGCEKPSDVS